MDKKSAIVDFPTTPELKKLLGLDKDGDVQRYMVHNAKRLMERHVPRRDGNLIDTAYEAKDAVVYPAPQARNMYKGIVMVDPETGLAGFKTEDGWKSRKGVKKVPSDREYEYNEAPERGKEWDKKMMEKQGKEFVEDTQNYINNRR